MACRRLCELAVGLVGQAFRQAGIVINRFGKPRGDVAFTLVEEGGATQPVLERYRRIVRARSAICALDPGLARQPVIVGVARVISRLRRLIAPGKGRWSNDRRLCLMNDWIVLRFDRGRLDDGFM